MIEKDPKTFRIMTLGNSFTAGIYVHTEKNWSSLLENMLNQNIKCSKINKFEVINLGVEGFDAAYEAERYKLRGAKYKPDLIVWFHTEFKKITELTMPLYFFNLAQSRKTGKLAEEGMKSEFYNEWNMGKSVILEKLGEKEILEHQEKYINDLSKTYKGSLVFAVDPYIPGNSKKVFKSIINTREKTYLLDNMRNIYNSGGVFKYDMHPNEKAMK